jgi:hypothetical protein
VTTTKSRGHPSFPGSLAGLLEIEDLFARSGDTIPSPNTVFKNIIQIVFRGRREEITELKVVETTMVVGIRVTEFIVIIDSGGIMCLETN